jgi:hypothetical protein
MSIFQKQICYNKDFSYDNQLFFCPKVYAKDGFEVSLQIHNGSYCSSNNGYRKLGDTIEEVEFGFPSYNEPLMFQYCEKWNSCSYDDNGNEIPFDETIFDITGSVGRIPISVMEKVFKLHSGIDWEKTISIEKFHKFVKD